MVTVAPLDAEKARTRRWPPQIAVRRTTSAVIANRSVAMASPELEPLPSISTSAATCLSAVQAARIAWSGVVLAFRDEHAVSTSAALRAQTAALVRSTVKVVNGFSLSFFHRDRDGD